VTRYFCFVNKGIRHKLGPRGHCQVWSGRRWR
jgi:hypothetical protein